MSVCIQDLAKPETFSLYAQSYFEDPYSYCREFLANLPVFYNPQEKCFIVSRYDDVKRVLEDYQTFGSGFGVLPLRKDDPEDYGFIL